MADWIIAYEEHFLVNCHSNFESRAPSDSELFGDQFTHKMMFLGSKEDSPVSWRMNPVQWKWFTEMLEESLEVDNG